MMDIERFWQLIEAALAMHDPPPIPDYGGLENERALAAVLAPLTPEEIVDFEQRYQQVVHSAYSWKLWGALFTIEGGASSNAFEDFRWELVMCGRAWFERALHDPDRLAEHPSPPVGLEGLSSVPRHVYELKTAQEEDFPYLDDPTLSEVDDPTDEPWEEDDLPIRYPRLWARFEGDEQPVAQKSESVVPPAPAAGAQPGTAGSRVRITEGPFANHEGVVKEAFEDTGLVHVIITVFGRPTVVEVRKDQMR